MTRAFFAFVLLLGACNTADSVTDREPTTTAATSQPQSASWRIEITSSGGFAGRGMGSVIIDDGTLEARNMSRQLCNGGPLPAAQRRELQRLVDTARPAAWRDHGPPPGAADMIEYTLTLTRNGESKSVKWTGEDVSMLPADLGALFETVWRIRTRACD